jgi:hypothetical protein
MPMKFGYSNEHCRPLISPARDPFDEPAGNLFQVVTVGVYGYEQRDCRENVKKRLQLSFDAIDASASC